MKATELLNADHPLHGLFVKFLAGKEPTKRQARKFLQKHWQYKEVKEA